MGVGLKGVILDDYKLTLDGDTFDIRGRIGDSLLIVLNSNQDDKTPYYLLKYERNGFYYPQIGASDISGSLEKVCGYRSTIKILFCPFIKLNNG